MTELVPPLQRLREEEREHIAKRKQVIGELEARAAVCEAVVQLGDSPAGKAFRASVAHLRDGYVRTAMAKNDTAALQRAAALEEMLSILDNAKERWQGLAQQIADEKNLLQSMTVVVHGEERLDPSGGIWR